jgi:hypothetical protein
MRRSSRAVLPTTSTNSVSSSSSTRAEQRSTRANQKHKSTTPSSEGELTRAATSEPPPPTSSRRSKRTTHDIEEEEDITKAEDEEDIAEEDIDEDGETTRCICGFQEYPGLPAEATSTSGHTRKGSHAPTIEADAQSDEAGGLFIQCDLCGVWQHGGCVGIMEQSAAPDNYYCEDEKCRPDLHQLFTSSTG